MTTATLLCGHCGHEQPIDPAYAGRQFACPGCGQAASARLRETASPRPAPQGSPPRTGSLHSPSGEPATGPAASNPLKAGTAAARSATRSALVSALTIQGANPLFVVRGLDALADAARRVFLPSRFTAQVGLLGTIGQYAVLLTALLTLVLGVILAVRLKATGYAFAGFVLCATVFFLQYTAMKFLGMLDAVRANSALVFSGRGFFEVGAASVFFFVFLALALTLAVLVSGGGSLPVLPAPDGAQDGASSLLIPAAAGIVGLYFLLYLVLNPEALLGVCFKERITGAEEFLSFMGLGVRLLLSLAPVLFGLGAAAAAGLLAWHTVSAPFTDNMLGLLASLPSTGFIFLSAALLPVYVYFLALTVHLFLDLALAVLRREREPKAGD